MKKIHSVLLILIMGVSFLLLSSYLKNKGDGVVRYVSDLSETCDGLHSKCNVIGSIFRELHNSGIGIKRQSISKDDLPIVRIYMNDGAIEKLDSKRVSVLTKLRPIHIAEDNDWVKATILVDNESQKERSKVSLRLKGDWGDHLENPKKLSFRIKTRGGGYLLGMKSFSIQHPTTRNYGREPLLLDHMRSNDILAPRYSFIDVFINDYPIGVMAIEEHFRKELIEFQNRRDGPLLAINEDPVWDQWNINYNVEPAVGDSGLNFSGLRDSMIKDFNKSKFDRGTIATNNRLRGQALLRDVIDGKISAREAFDYEKLSKYWVLVNIWGGCHSSVWHNRRFYFNPISGLIEPVSFDNIPNPEHFKICSGFDVKAALQDPQFLTQVRLSAAEIYEQLKSEKFYEKFRAKQKLHAKIFDYEEFSDRLKPVSPQVLVKNLRKLLVELSNNYEEYGAYEKAFVPQVTDLVGRKFLESQKNLNLHMSSFYYPEVDGGNLEFRSVVLKPISIQSIYLPRKKGKRRPFDFDFFDLASGDLVEIPLNISNEVLRKHAELMVEYEYNGKLYQRPVYVQFKESPTGFVKNPIQSIRKINGHKWVDVKGKQVIFAEGIHDFTESIALPKGWKVVFQAGAVANFKNGVLLKVQGPLSINGDKDQTVEINVESREDYKDMGSWGGLLVSKSKERSYVNYLNLKGTGHQNLHTRQGFYGMTGCLSFYESDVDISNSTFLNAQCEDALNIVKSDFNIESTVIEGARADAFDSDFSTGLIANSKFMASGNDGVDVSGTSLTLQNVVMENIGDKAISVGEKSSLVAEDIYIDGAVLGLVSKDRSNALAKKVKFENISGTAIMTYIKKQEYGPSSAECNECSFVGDLVLTGSQEGTKIRLNGSVIQNASLTQKQMYDSGLIEGR